MTPKFSYQNPTIGEYNDLRKSVDWPTFAPNLVELALANSLFSVVARDDGRILGMGRIVGDGAIYLHIQDVIVRPEFQRQGIGRLIMNELLSFVKRLAVNTQTWDSCAVKDAKNFIKTLDLLKDQTKNLALE